MPFDLNQTFKCEGCGKEVAYKDAFRCCYCSKKFCDDCSCDPERPMAVCCSRECVRQAWTTESVPDEEFDEFYSGLMEEREEYLRERK